MKGSAFETLAIFFDRLSTCPGRYESNVRMRGITWGKDLEDYWSFVVLLEELDENGYKIQRKNQQGSKAK